MQLIMNFMNSLFYFAVTMLPSADQWCAVVKGTLNNS